jgi:FkbM family methyltransferase
MVIPMLSKILNFVNQILKKGNFSLKRVNNFPNVLQALEISLVLDVGANSGQYARSIRKDGYRKRIISFEPLSTAHLSLTQNSEADELWSVFKRTALGSSMAILNLNVSGNSYSSSIKGMLPSHKIAAPESEFIGIELCEVITLDSIFSQLVADNDSIFLKIDTQGYEKEVLKGAEKSLGFITAIQLEISLTPLYEDSTSFEYFMSFFEKNNFILWDLIPGFRENTSGRLLQADAVYVNSKFWN